jgi:hypothetical protein
MIGWGPDIRCAQAVQSSFGKQAAPRKRGFLLYGRHCTKSHGKIKSLAFRPAQAQTLAMELIFDIAAGIVLSVPMMWVAAWIVYLIWLMAVPYKPAEE